MRVTSSAERRYAAGLLSTSQMPSASADGLCGVTSVPIPVHRIAIRAPGMSVITQGVPQVIASSGTSGRLSVRLGTAIRSHIA